MSHRYQFAHSNMARTCTKLHLQEFAINRQTFILYKDEMTSHRSTIGTQVNKRCLRHLEERCEGERVSFPKTQRES